MRNLLTSLLFVSIFLIGCVHIIAQQPPTPSTGCVSGNCVNGKGKKIYGNGNIYEGDFVNGKLAGKGKFTIKNGQVYVGQFANDTFNGKGKYTFADGATYEGDWVNGKREGKGTYATKNGVYTGQYANDERSGKGNEKYPNGEIYDGDWVNGVKSGQGTLTFKTGGYHIGGFKSNAKNGYGKEYDRSKKLIREGTWKDGVLSLTTSTTAPNPTPSGPKFPVAETATLLRDMLDGKLGFFDIKPLVYKLKMKKSGETLLYRIEFISDGGKLAFKWKESTKNEQSEKLVITDKALASASKYVNFFASKTKIAPDTEIAFILSQTLYEALKSKDEISVDLGKGPQQFSYNFSMTAITGVYSNKSLKMMYLQGDGGKTKIEILDDPICPLIVGIETGEYTLTLVRD